MVTVQDFYTYLDALCPFAAQENWDNSGMLIGDAAQEVTRAAVVLDITPEAIAYAKQIGAELIISHHPVIFRPKKRFLKGDPAFMLAENGISAICAHTCLDCAEGGVNDVLAQALGIENAEVFPCEESPNLLRAGVLAQPMTAQELARQIKEILGGSVAYCDNGGLIESVAVCGGAGGSCIGDVCAAGIDAFITGESNYHGFLDAKAAGLNLFAAGHFETENPVVFALAARLRAQFPAVDIAIIPQSSPIITE